MYRTVSSRGVPEETRGRVSWHTTLDTCVYKIVLRMNKEGVGQGLEE